MAEHYPFPLNVIRRVFPFLESVLPKVAGAIAVRLFLTPIRFGFTAKEKEFMAKLEQFKIEADGVELQGYALGEGPAVLCMHGWAGRALQFRMFAEALAANGFRFVAFDALAHGKSPGKQSSLFDFAKGIGQLIQMQPNGIKAIVAHSLGAASSSYFASQGGPIPALVTLGAPVVAQDILDSFTDTINGTRQSQAYIRAKAVSAFNTEFDDVAMERTFGNLEIPVFALHGTEDKDVSVTHLDVLKNIRPEIDTKTYPGVGHRRILKDDKAIGDVIKWLKKL